MQNFFVETSSVQDGIIHLSGADVNHMKNVLRMRPGEPVQIQDGQGITYTCRISGYEDREAILEILETRTADTELPSALYLFQGLPKGDKMEWIVQKAVELGVGEIIPVLTRRCVSRPDPKSFEKKRVRLARIAAEAAKQSGRGRIPQVREMMDLRPALEEMAARPGAMLFYERSTAPMREVLDRIEGEASLLIGAEGGFDESEVELALSMGIPSLTLDPRILRCETAPMAALSVLMYHTGNMN